MENNIRFRSHASIILEKSLKTIGTAVFIFVWHFISELGETEMGIMDLLLLIAVLVIVSGLIMGFHAIIWARTYISIEENTLVVERSIINKKRNNIGLKHISNVNLEQNLLEMMLGTCKVKLDTNSVSTADQTDVSIVLKKLEAENFRSIVLARAEGKEIQLVGEGLSAEIQIKEEIQATAEAKTTENVQNTPITSNMQAQATDTESRTLIGDIGDIILHGLFSIRISQVVLLIGISLVQFVLLTEMEANGWGVSIVEFFVNLVTMFWFPAIIIWNIAKEFIKYLNFRIQRKKDRVFLSYGLFKKSAYSVPVDKINGIRLTQTPIARMAKRYMVEIINVGMDDDEKETNTFFLPYGKIETIKEQLHLLLPEFDGCIDVKEEKQPKEVWLLSIPWVFLYITTTVAVYVATAKFQAISKGILVAAAAIALGWLIVKVAGFLTKGVAVHEKFLKIVNGGFARRIIFVKYDKIQHVTGKQCIIAKQFKIQKGYIFLLASKKNRFHELPYFKENNMEVLKKQLI